MAIITVYPRIGLDCNIYAVTGENPILIDAGTGMDSDNAVGCLEKNGLVPSAIIATHCHYDHSGGIPALRERYGCEVYAGVGDIPYLRTADADYCVSGLLGGKMEPVEAKPLKEGDVIDTGDHSFIVLETPGHTPGSICLYEKDTGYLISGDTLFTHGFGRTDFSGGSMDEMRSSLTRISKLDIRGLFPGHENTCNPYDFNLMKRVLMMAGV